MPVWKTVLVLLLGLACGVGCVAVSVWALKKTSQAKVFAYKYRDVTLEVVDDETDEPVAKAKVEVTYEDNRIVQPEPDSVESDSKGMATVKFALKRTDLNLSVDAKGYSSARGGCNPEMSSPIPCRLKKLPQVTLTVPNGYVGPIRFNLPQHPDYRQETTYRKEFQFHADAAGDVKIEDVETDLNYRALERSLQKAYLLATYEDGRKILLAHDEGVKDSTIALRRVGLYCEEDFSKLQEVFIIGTAQEQKTLHNSLPAMGRIEIDIGVDLYDSVWGRRHF